MPSTLNENAPSFAPSAPTAPSGQTKKFLGLLYVTVCTFAALYTPQPLLSSIQSDYPALEASTITLLMTAALFPLGVGPLLYGFFLSSLSTRKVLLVCVGLLSMAEFGLFYYTQFEVMLAFRLLQGLLIPAILTCLMAHIAAKFRGTALQRAMAVYIGVTVLGGLLGRVLSGFVASLCGWRYAFLLWGLALLVALVPMLCLQAEGKAHFARVRLQEFREILAIRGMCSLLFIDFIGFFVYSGISNVLPFYMQQKWGGFSEWHISLMYLSMGFGMVTAFASSRLQSLFGGELRTIMAGLCLYCAATPLLLYPHVLVIFVAICLVCIGQFTEHSISPGLINRLSGEHDKSAVNGLYLSLYYCGGALGSYLPVMVYSAFGWEVFIGFLTLCLGLFLLVTANLMRILPRSALQAKGL